MITRLLALRERVWMHSTRELAEAMERAAEVGFRKGRECGFLAGYRTAVRHCSRRDPRIVPFAQPRRLRAIDEKDRLH